VNLRPATGDDAGAVHALDAALFGLDAWSAGAVAEEVAARRCVLATDDDGAVVGYLVTAPAGDVLDLLRVGVEPACRRHGVGRALLGTLPVAVRVLLEVSEANHGAVAFYAAAGFTAIDRRRRYYRDGTDALVMERPAQ